MTGNDESERQDEFGKLSPWWIAVNPRLKVFRNDRATPHFTFQETTMPMQLKEERDGKVLIIHVTGKLVKADYEQLVTEFARLVEQQRCDQP